MFQLLHGNEEAYPRTSPFYEPLSDIHKNKILQWIQSWRQALQHSDNAVERMRTANPKYILREWMLVQAYTKAQQGDYTVLHQLQHLIQNPYEEGTELEEDLFYKRAPDEAFTQGGTAFMT